MARVAKRNASLKICIFYFFEAVVQANNLSLLQLIARFNVEKKKESSPPP